MMHEMIQFTPTGPAGRGTNRRGGLSGQTGPGGRGSNRRGGITPAR